MKSAEEEQKEAVQVAGKGGKSSNVFSVDLLRLYYEFLFPYDEMYRWLSYDAQVSGDCFKRREFSFTIENDIYIRYLSFAGMEEMKKEIKRKQPHKIDIGAVYTCPPKDHNTVRANAFKPVSRELVFDIDLTDYNEFLRNEESDPLWAYGSWQLMAVAIKTLDMTLREDFGFQHLLWVFSGRRGVHCWVCDEKARQLTDRERAGLVGYLTVVNGNESSSDRVALTWPLHPFVQKILPTLRECFESKLLPESGQDLLKDPKSWDRVLKQIPDIDVQKRLRHTWERETDSSSTKKWAQLKATVQDEASKYKAASKKSKAENLEKSIPAIILLHTYARLDVNVSTHRNHLLKSPFVIHPKVSEAYAYKAILSPMGRRNTPKNVTLATDRKGVRADT